MQRLQHPQMILRDCHQSEKTKGTGGTIDTLFASGVIVICALTLVLAIVIAIGPRLTRTRAVALTTAITDAGFLAFKLVWLVPPPFVSPLGFR